MNRKRSLPQQSEASQENKPKLSLYLDDNTPVRTIEVSNVPTDSSEDCSEEFIRGYFERYGPVERVDITKKTTNEWLAYVTFVLPENAAELIHNKDSAGNARCSKFAIKIADDVHQIKIVPNVLSLEKVNDQCLLQIMSHLSFFDVINLCKTSKRMQAVGQLYFKKFKTFSYGAFQRGSSASGPSLPVILETIGDHINSIDWFDLTAAHLDLLAKYCPNVTELKLTSTNRDVNKAINRNKGFFGNLKKLHIESSDDIFDVHIQNMMSGKKLTTLNIQQCDKICGKFFTKTNHVKLKNIKIVVCKNVKKENFNLHEWKGTLTTFVSDTCGSYLPLLALPTEKLERIEELYLDISCFEGVTAGLNFSGLKKLKKLTLAREHKFYCINSDNMIDELSQIDTLESLTIEGIIIDTATIQRLRSLKSLKYLKMMWISNKIGRNLYEQIREYVPTLRELSIYFKGLPIIMGKEVFDMIAAMPMLQYFSHSSINWKWLDEIREYKSITALDEKKPPLKIGAGQCVFNKPKKEAFEAIHKGAITLCYE